MSHKGHGPRLSKMFSWRIEKPRDAYNEVPSTDLEAEGGNFEGTKGLETIEANGLRSVTQSMTYGYAFSVMIKVLFFGSFVFLLYRDWTNRHSENCVLGNENIYADAPIQYTNTWFARAGFHDHRHSATTMFEGKPNEDNDRAWKNILQVGIIGISQQENLQLVNGSAATRKDDGQYVVQLEMSHQLHCLSWLRHQVWMLEEAVMTKSEAEDVPQRQNHTDHCIDYLRQAIMCQGDITPMTFEWNSEIGTYVGHHTVEHQCRDFGAIFEWAQKRNTTGLTPGGNHINVELQQTQDYA